MGGSGCTVKYAGEDKSGMVGMCARVCMVGVKGGWVDGWVISNASTKDGIVCMHFGRLSKSKMRKL